MRVSRRDAVTLAAVALVILEGIGVSAVLRGGIAPPAPSLDAFPEALGAWIRTKDLTPSATTAAQLQTDRILDRVYVRPQTSIPLELFVAWFKTQRGGAQPHSPKVCLPGAGWLPVATSVVTLGTSAGMVPVNVYAVTNRGKSAQILYWYQTPRRALASEWASKLFTIVDGIRDQRTDIAVVRITVAGGPASPAAQEARAFAQAVYPELRRALPH